MCIVSVVSLTVLFSFTFAVKARRCLARLVYHAIHGDRRERFSWSNTEFVRELYRNRFIICIVRAGSITGYFDGPRNVRVIRSCGDTGFFKRNARNKSFQTAVVVAQLFFRFRLDRNCAILETKEPRNSFSKDESEIFKSSSPSRSTIGRSTSIIGNEARLRHGTTETILADEQQRPLSTSHYVVSFTRALPAWINPPRVAESFSRIDDVCKKEIVSLDETANAGALRRRRRGGERKLDLVLAPLFFVSRPLLEKILSRCRRKYLPFEFGRGELVVSRTHARLEKRLLLGIVALARPLLYATLRSLRSPLVNVRQDDTLL